MGMLGCTALCQTHQSPAPQIPPGEDAKGSKRPLLRRDWSSTWQGDRPGDTLEQKAFVPRHQDAAKPGFPRHCKAQSPQPCSGSLGHQKQAFISGRPGATLPTPGSLLAKPVLARVPFVPRQDVGPEQALPVLICSVITAKPSARLGSWCSVSACAWCQVSLQHRPLAVTRCSCSFKGTFICLFPSGLLPFCRQPPLHDPRRFSQTMPSTKKV